MVLEKSLTSLEKVGAKLRQTREEKLLTTKKLAQSLQIGEEQLIALENGEEKLLPEHIFIKAMIRRVSDRLGLDAAPFLDQIQRDGHNNLNSSS